MTHSREKYPQPSSFLEKGASYHNAGCLTPCLMSKSKGADPGVQAVSPQVTISHPPGKLPGMRLPSQPQSITIHHPLAGTKLYWLVTEAYMCEQLAQGCYAIRSWWVNTRSQQFAENWKLIYFGNHTQTLFFRLVTIVVLAVIFT